jgi:hypothetical protein
MSKNQRFGCRNPNLGLATKVKGLQDYGSRGSLGVTLYIPGSVRKCEGVNPHTPNATFTLGDGVATLTWPSVGVKPNTWKSWGLGVLRDS